jgi:cell wall-associated NlpC family hydrolase
VKRLALGACTLVLLAIPFLAAAVGVFGGGVGVSLGAGTPVAVAGIPPQYLALFQAAGQRYDVPWAVLAGIGKVECDDGRDPDSSCTREGALNYAGAGGPMQFLASTWASYAVDGDGDGRADRWDPADAIFTAANYLRASGAGQDLRGAIYAYNHSTAYVEAVLRWASAYERQAQAGTLIAPSAAAAQAVSFALSKIGTPYVWGGESAAGFDCSGLVQAAYRTAGLALPRTAQEQFDAGPHLAPGAAPQPGDLVFFGQSATDVGHVGIVVRAGEMVDAPHTGASVRTEPYPTAAGAAWGKELYLGATRPSAGTSR